MTETRISEVQSHFDKRASNYSSLYDANERTGAAFGFLRRQQLVVAHASQLKGKFLDCACGTGELTNEVLAAGSFSQAIVNDYSIEMLVRAKSKITCSNIDYCNFDAFQLGDKLQPHSFDLVCCLGLAAHVGRIGDLFSGIKKLLTKEGVLLFQSSLYDHWGNKAVNLISSARHERLHGYRQHVFCKRQILESARQSGMRCTSIERFSIGFPFGDRLLPKANYHLEKYLQPVSKFIGAEAIFRFEKV